MDKNAVDVWYGYRSKVYVKYELPFYLYVVNMPERGPDGWFPISGTGYPYSGQQFVYIPPNENVLSQAIQSGCNVGTSEDTSPAMISIYAFVSGTVNPTQSSSWYQSTTAKINAGTSANTPNQEVAGVYASGINVSGNSTYTTPANENLSTFQIAGKYQYSLQSGTTIRSGVSNVPTSESSWNH